MAEEPYSIAKDSLFPKALDVINAVVRKPPNPDILYHYTSPEAARLIIERGVVRASNIQYMNDPSEVRYASDVIAGVIADYLPQLPETPARILRHISTIIARTLEKFDYYVASFSAEPDLLGQWRAYCMSGRGFALGYRGAPLTRMNREVYLFRVTYDREEQEQAARSIIDIYLPGLIVAADSRSRDLTVAAGAALGVPLALLLLAFKHKAYAEEREYRLVRSGVRAIPTEQVQFRSTSNMIVPFIEFDLADHRENSTGKAPLAEVVIGPSVDAPRSEKSLRMLTQKLGYSPKIWASKVPFVG